MKVVTYIYENEYNKAPRGVNTWWFNLSDDLNDPHADCQGFGFQGSYGEAKKEAIKEAKRLGFSAIAVIP